MKFQYKAILALLSTGIVLSMVPQVWGAGESTDGISMAGHVFAFASFVGAGLFYSVSGYIKAFRRKFAGETVAIDYHKLGKNALLGVILGSVAFVYSAYLGEVIHINTLEQFLIQVGLNTAAILFVDKWILGRTEKQ